MTAMGSGSGGYERLKEKHRRVRDGMPVNLSLRIHRALSWMQRAEKEADDDDAAFILYWIALNAAYAEDRGEFRDPERDMLRNYFGKLIGLDNGKAVYGAIWQKFPNAIRSLLDNPYIFEPFWRFHNQLPGYADCKSGSRPASGRSSSPCATRTR